MTAPAGLPNTSTLSNFNGSGKQNYTALPPSNPITDWDNPSLAQAISDVAGLGLTGARVVMTVTLAASTGGLALVQYWTQWGNVTTTLPILTRTGTGIFTFAVPAVVSGEYQASIGNTGTYTVNLQAPIGAGFMSTTFGFINVSVSGNVITVHTANAAGSANDMAGQTIYVAVR